VLGATDELKIATLSMVRGERGYVISGMDDYLQPYREGRREARKQLADLHTMLADSPEQSTMLDAVGAELEHYIGLSTNVIALKRRALEMDAVTEIGIAEGRKSLETILANIRDIEQHEQRVLAQHAIVANQRANEIELFQYFLSAIGLGLIVLCVLAMRFLNRAVAAEAEVRTELRRLASTDELTGVANRREFLNLLQRSIDLARNSGEMLAVAIFDIDHFKRVNDTYGHPAGDAVIRKVAAIALDTVRSQDVVGRIGGEEFAIILSGCTPGEAFTICERLRVAVQQERLELETGDAFCVTVSTGIAAIRETDDARSLIARADEALYSAKNDGRDRVLMAA
jgi:diguanylate cyclase (GGDEF)-like protein